MNESRYFMPITAACLSISQMLPSHHVPICGNTPSFVSQNYSLTKDELMLELCAQTPIHPCHEDEEVEIHTSHEVLEAEFEEKPSKRRNRNA